MSELEVLQIDGKNVIDSRVVAERVGMQHKNLLKKIKNYEETLAGSNYSPLDFFIPHEYKDVQGKMRLCYLLSKEGCEMIAHKLTGNEGILFTAEYINAFHHMEKEITGNIAHDFRDIPLDALGSYLRVAMKEMKSGGKTPKERLEVFKQVSDQFGVNLPSDFAVVRYQQDSLF